MARREICIYVIDLPEFDVLEFGSKFEVLEKFCDEEVKALEHTALKQPTRNFNGQRNIVGMIFVKKNPVDGDTVILQWLNYWSCGSHGGNDG